MPLAPWRGVPFDPPAPVAQTPNQYLWLDGTVRDGTGPNANIIIASAPELLHTNIVASLIYKLTSVLGTDKAVQSSLTVAGHALTSNVTITASDVGAPSGIGISTGTNTGDQTITLTGGVTGSGTGSFAATVQTNANLTGPITSTGNATAIASQTGIGTTFVMSAGPSGTGAWSITGTAGTGTQSPTLTITGPAHTALTASTENIGINLNMSATKQFAAGALALQREVLIQAPTYSAVAATTITEADTLYVQAPIAGTNVTTTRKNAIVSEGTLVSRAFGGTAGRDEIQIVANITNGQIFTPSGNNSIFMFVGGNSTFGFQIGFGGGTVSFGGNNIGFGSDNTHYDCGFKRIVQSVIGTDTGQSTWFQNTAARKRNTADVTNATATMANLTDLTMTLIAGRKYTGRCVLIANNSVGVEGLQFDFNGGGATFSAFQATAESSPVGATLGVSNSTALGTAITDTVVATTDTIYAINLTMVVNAAGTFIPRFAEVSHTTGTATVRLGSYMWLEDMPN